MMKLTKEALREENRRQYDAGLRPGTKEYTDNVVGALNAIGYDCYAKEVHPNWFIAFPTAEFKNDKIIDVPVQIGEFDAIKELRLPISPPDTQDGYR